MQPIFEVMKITPEAKNDSPSVRLGIRIRVGGQDSLCPFTGPYDNYEALAADVEDLKKALDDLSKSAETLLPKAARTSASLESDLPPEKIWAVLSNLTDDESFILGFNELDEEKRKAIAEYVLTRCNIFSGRAAFFSSRYDQGTGLME